MPRAHLRTALCFAILAACSPARRVLHHEPSGFLEDYAKLDTPRRGGAAVTYHNPAAHWTTYDKVLLEPVTIWRSGTGSLEAIPTADLARLAVDLDAAVRRRLAESFLLVATPGPGVMRIRLAVTAARASDAVKDVRRFEGIGAFPVTSGSGPLHAEIRRFLESAAVEGEILDGETNEILAMGLEQYHADRGIAFETWEDVDRAIEAWAERVVGHLERRTGHP